MGELVELVRRLQMPPQPFEQRREPIAFGRRRHGLLDVLRLTALPVRRDDHAPRGAVRGLGAVAHAQQVQAAVDARGRARRSEHVAVVHVQHLGLQHDLRVLFGERRGQVPVRGGGPAVEQAGLGQHEGAQAQPDHGGAAPVRRLQRTDQRGRRGPAVVAP
ncbi:hypothetical protein D9M68_621400 [compost metagenome]